MGELPLVTVITPAYNRADYLAEVIESVLGQQYPRIEYIVLDDGSTDRTREVMDRYAGRIRAETHANMGETRTVNRGFELATGEIVGVVNSDDPLLPGAIRRTVDAFTAHPEVVVTYPDWNMIDSTGALIRTVHTLEYDYLTMLRWHHCTPGPGAFFRRSVIEQLGGRDPAFRYIADFDFWLRAGLLGPFLRIPDVLATFRHHAGGATSAARGRAMAQEHIDLFDKIFALPGLPASARAVRREAWSSALYAAGLVSSSRSAMIKKRYYVRSFLASPTRFFTQAPYTGRRRTMLRELRSGWRRHAGSLARRLIRRGRGANRVAC